MIYSGISRKIIDIYSGISRKIIDIFKKKVLFMKRLVVGLKTQDKLSSRCITGKNASQEELESSSKS